MDIGILCADRVREELQPSWGDYPEMFAALLEGTGREVKVRAYDAQLNRYPEPDAHDAYIITGSRHSVFGDEPWIMPLVRFVGAALAARCKVVGICFGHQLIAHYFGGRAATAESGWGLGVSSARVLSQESWMQPNASSFDLVAVHQDQVVDLPDNARLLFSSEFCPNAGFVIGEQVLSFQWHPEFTKSYTEALLQLRRLEFDDDTFERATASLVSHTDERLVAEWILNFLASRVQ